MLSINSKTMQFVLRIFRNFGSDHFFLFSKVDFFSNFFFFPKKGLNYRTCSKSNFFCSSFKRFHGFLGKMTKIQIWIFLRILVGFKKFFLPKESICLRCYKQNVFFFIITYSLLGRGPKCLQKFLLKKCQKWPKVFLRRIFQKKRKTFFFVPNRKRTHSCNYVADHFFYILFFCLAFGFKARSCQKFLPKIVKFCLYFLKGIPK